MTGLQIICEIHSGRANILLEEFTVQADINRLTVAFSACVCVSLCFISTGLPQTHNPSTPVQIMHFIILPAAVVLEIIRPCKVC